MACLARRITYMLRGPGDGPVHSCICSPRTVCALGKSRPTPAAARSLSRSCTRAGYGLRVSSLLPFSPDRCFDLVAPDSVGRAPGPGTLWLLDVCWGLIPSPRLRMAKTLCGAPFAVTAARSQVLSCFGPFGGIWPNPGDAMMSPDHSGTHNLSEARGPRGAMFSPSERGH